MQISSRAAAMGAAGAGCVGALLLSVPASAAGPTYPPPAFGGGGATTFGTTFDAPAVQPAPARLPTTGGDLPLLLTTAGLLVAAGGVTLVLGRRRRTT